MYSVQQEKKNVSSFLIYTESLVSGHKFNEIAINGKKRQLKNALTVRFMSKLRVSSKTKCAFFITKAISCRLYF